jgi:hypothetical protein
VRGAHLPTVDELATSLRDQQELCGLSRSYREHCERIQPFSSLSRINF